MNARTKGRPRGLGPRLALLALLGWAAPAGGQAPPQISLEPQNEGVLLPSMFEAALAHTTPAYVSLDEPRSVTLLYSSAQAEPRPLVQVDVTPAAGDVPEKLSISLLDGSGTRVLLANGSTENFYAAGSGGTQRLAAQLDASALSTGAYLYTVAVRSWQGTRFAEARAPVRVLVVNERASPFGAGWSLAGLQRVHVQADSSVVITGGDGSAVYFTWTGCGADECAFLSPAGEFSSLRKVVERDPWGGVMGVWYERGYLDGTTLEFPLSPDGSWLLAESRDRVGSRVEYGYDTSDRLRTIRDPTGKTVTLDYDARGRLASITDPGGRVTRVEVDRAGRLARLVDPDGVAALRAHYDRAGRLVQHWDRAGSGFGLEYDGAGRLAAEVLPQVRIDGGGRVRPTTRYRSWAAAVLPGEGRGGFAAPAEGLAPGSARARVTDPRGDSTLLALDRWGTPWRVEEPLGRVTEVARDARGLDTLVTAPSGHRVRYGWSGASLTRVEDLTTGRTVHYRYGAFAQVDSVWGDVPAARYYLDALGLPDSVRIAGEAGVTRYRYAALGRPDTIVDPEGHATFVHYAAGGWMNTDSVQSGALGSGYRRRTAYAYDGFGRERAVTDPLGRADSVRYDALNRVVDAFSAEGGQMQYHYGPLHLEYLTDWEGKLYKFHSNALGWTDSLQVPGDYGRGTAERFAYDAAGKVVRHTNRRGQAVTYTYDALGRVTSRTAGGQVTAYAADPLGRFSTASNVESTDTVHFDPAGRPDTVVSVRGGTRYAWVVEHDARDRRTALRLVSPWTRERGYGYNGEGQLAVLRGLGGDTTRLEYDPDRLLERVVMPGGIEVARDYASTHEATYERYLQGGSPHPTLDARLGRGYAYGRRGELGVRYSAGRDTAWTYGYDEAGRLAGYTVEHIEAPDCPGTEIDHDTGFCAPDGVRTPLAEATYAYDRVGNRTDAGAQYEPNTNRLIAFGGYSLAYDADGNLTRKHWAADSLQYDQRLSWNALGELESVTTNGVTLSYGYDGWGRRVRRTGSDGEERLVYDGAELLLEDGVVRREYAYLPGIDRPHSVLTGGSVYYYGREHTGNVTGLYDAGGTLRGEYRYTPFGEARLAWEAVENPLRYQGREWEGGSGLYYFRARWYDPELGRFLSPDPIGLAGGINPYAFAGNDPVNRTDPLGLQDCTSFDARTGVAYQEPGTACPVGGVTGWGTPRSFGGGFLSSTGRGPGVGFSHFDAARGITRGQIEDGRQLGERAGDMVQAIAECAVEHYTGIGTLEWSGRAASALGVPVPKSWYGLPTYPGTSKVTTGISAASVYLRRVGVDFGRLGFRMMGTAKPLRVVGRSASYIAPPVAAALLAYDVYSIGSCAIAK